MATAALLPMARAVFFDANGSPVSGGLVSTYVPGGTVGKTTWQDSAETIPNANPIVLDSAGSALIYGDGSYQLTVTDALGNAVPAYCGVTTTNQTVVSSAMLPVVGATSLSAGFGLLAQQVASGHFYNNLGATVDRFSDRVLIGGSAIANAATYPITGSTWVAAAASGYMTYLDQICQAQIISTIGGVALSLASRSSDNNNSMAPLPVFDGTFGSATYVQNDNILTGHSTWGHYVHAVNNSAISLATHCIEVDICNRQTVVDCNPYLAGATGTTSDLWLGVGGETAQSGLSSNPTSVAVAIVSNGTRNAIAKTGSLHGKGIVFMADAIAGGDGVTSGSAATAVEMAFGHQIVWRYSGGANANGGIIRSDNKDSNFQTRLLFGAAGFLVAGTKADLVTEVALLQVTPNQNAVNYCNIVAGATGSGVSINAAGSDTNIDLLLGPKGSGVIRLGYLSTAAATPASFTADRVLAFKDASGTNYFIPAKTTGW